MAIDDPWFQSLEQSTVNHQDDSPPVEQRLVPGLTILSHPDPARVGASAVLSRLSAGRPLELSRSSPLFFKPRTHESFPLADPHLSRRPILIAQGQEPDSISLLRHQWRSSLAVDGRPADEQHTWASDQLEPGIVILLANRVCLLLHLISPAPSRSPRLLGLVGDSHPMEELRRQIQNVAPLSVAVLLRGETGTGKELVARAVHRGSPRQGRPYLAINMAAVPTSLAASELFGAAQGAFTGADRRRTGFFQRTDGGTLFLDEIAEAPVEIQTLLLRALETGEVQPVGSELPQRLDVRIIAATDADLEKAGESGAFRAPLLHRLKGFEIHIPPLRKRRDDIGRLLIHFLKDEAESMGRPDLLDDPGPKGKPWLPAALVARLALHHWPGNVRELRNVARRLVINSARLPEARLDFELGAAKTSTTALDLDSTPLPVPTPPMSTKPARRSYRSPDDIDDQELVATLRKHRWRLLPTAKELRVSRTSLYKLIDQCSEIRRAGDLSREEILDALVPAEGDIDAAVEALEVSRQGLLRRIRELGIEGY